uniref:Cytosol aminopeptidase domain-containing protein n=1 Tax=Anguilla anguilla TaxID=7936 RepID=A0A0E9RJJ1_ANGAN
MADMKNFDRSKAPCSCGGLFVGAQLGFDWPGAWIHVDMVFPAYSGERATGYGVALLLALFGRATDRPPPTAGRPPWVQTWTDPWKTATLPVAAQSDKKLI